jgi:acetoin utilization protein AcuB
MSRTDLPNEMLVGAWMNQPEHVVAPDAPVDEAFAVMRRAGVRHLLVVSSDELVGVVTDRDLRRPDSNNGDVMSVSEMYKIGEDLTVEDVMTGEPTTVTPEALTSEAAKLMVDNKYNCLPVVRDTKVLGIITSSDLLAALVHEVDPEFVAARALEAG